MDDALSIVLLVAAFYAGKLVLRLISHRSVLVPQISFLEAEVARISGQADDEYLSAISPGNGSPDSSISSADYRPERFASRCS